MTARSGDALSHVNFHARQNVVLTEIRAPEFWRWPRAAIRPPLKARIRSNRICMAAMRRQRGTNAADPLHLLITCLNLFASKDDCIRK
jgi:hypothetical protein